MKVFRDGALNAAFGVTKLSISKLRILAVSEMIDVEVLIAPLMSSSKSTVSSNASADAPTPPPPDKVTRGACVYPLPGSLIATETTCPLKIKAEPCACTPSPIGGAISTVGGEIYPEPPVIMLISLTRCPVLLIPTRGKPVLASNCVLRISFSNEPVPPRTVSSSLPTSLGFEP